MMLLTALLLVLAPPAAKAAGDPDDLIRSYHCSSGRADPSGREADIALIREVAAAGNDVIARAVLRIMDFNVFSWAYCHGEKDLFLFLSRNVPPESRKAADNLAGALKHLIGHRPRSFWTVQELLDRGMPLETETREIDTSRRQSFLRASVDPWPYRPNIELLEYLLARGVSVLEPGSKDGGTALHVALKTIQLLPAWSIEGNPLSPPRSVIEDDYLRILDALIAAAGGDRTAFVNQANSYGATPLAIAASFHPPGRNRMGDERREYAQYEAYYDGGAENTAQGKAIDKLLAAGVDINLPLSNDLGSALGAAIAAGNPYMVEFLLSRGADRSGWERHIARFEQGRAGWDPYNEASRPERLEKMREILSKTR